MLVKPRWSAKLSGSLVGNQLIRLLLLLIQLYTYILLRDGAIITNVGKLLEKRGKEFLGSRYKDPISSFSEFQEFSVSNPEVIYKTEMSLFDKLLFGLLNYINKFAGLLENRFGRTRYFILSAASTYFEGGALYWKRDLSPRRSMASWSIFKSCKELPVFK